MGKKSSGKKKAPHGKLDLHVEFAQVSHNGREYLVAGLVVRYPNKKGLPHQRTYGHVAEIKSKNHSALAEAFSFTLSKLTKKSNGFSVRLTCEEKARTLDLKALSPAQIKQAESLELNATFLKIVRGQAQGNEDMTVLWQENASRMSFRDKWDPTADYEREDPASPIPEMQSLGQVVLEQALTNLVTYQSDTRDYC